MYKKPTTHKQHKRTGNNKPMEGCESTCGVAQENTDSERKRKKRDANVRRIFPIDSG